MSLGCTATFPSCIQPPRPIACVHPCVFSELLRRAIAIVTDRASSSFLDHASTAASALRYMRDSRMRCIIDTHRCASMRAQIKIVSAKSGRSDLSVVKAATVARASSMMRRAYLDISIVSRFSNRRRAKRLVFPNGGILAWFPRASTNSRLNKWVEPILTTVNVAAPYRRIRCFLSIHTRARARADICAAAARARRSKPAIYPARGTPTCLHRVNLCIRVRVHPTKVHMLYNARPALRRRCRARGKILGRDFDDSIKIEERGPSETRHARGSHVSFY